MIRPLDHEGELEVIIDVGDRGIAPEDAMGDVWGYSLPNDVVARDLRLRHKQWFPGKSLDTFAPPGSFVVTANEVELARTRRATTVDGEKRQDTLGTDMILRHSDPDRDDQRGGDAQAWGHISATRTPRGVGIGIDPPRSAGRVTR